ncbi:MAG: hypothetical protein VX494_14685 [Actinomycetota bacterium]|nr:hypothetical protein [Actinomycetota bacterium]
MTPRPTEAECIRRAGAVLAASDLAIAQMTPREQAEAAWTPTEPFSIEEKEDLIRERRGLSPVHHDAAAMKRLRSRRTEWRRKRTPSGGGGPAKTVSSDGT